MQSRVLNETRTQAGSTSVDGSVITDSILATLWVDSTAGDLTVEIFTLTDSGKEVSVIQFPVISSGSTELLLKKAAITMQRFRVVATYTGACQYEVYVRALNGAGESSVKIIGPANLQTSQETVTSTPAALIPSALTDRTGITIKNYSGGATLFVSEDISKLPGEAWPITPGEVWFLDVASGVTIYAVSASSDLDIRIAQAGG